MSSEDNLEMGSIILALNMVFFSVFGFGMYSLYKRNKVNLLKIFLVFYYIFLTISFILHNSIMNYLIIEMHREYIFVPIFNILLTTYQSINLLHFLKHKKTNPYVTLSINIAIIFFSIMNLTVIEDEMFHTQFLFFISIYGIISSIIFNFLTIFLIYFKCYLDIFFYQHNLYSEINQSLNEDCPICLEPLNMNVIKTNCNHYFHKECIIQSLLIKKDCPMCRQEIV